MPLDPQRETMRSSAASPVQAGPSGLSLEEVRAQARSLRLPPGPAAVVDSWSAPGPAGPLTLRTYRPERVAGLRGGLVFFAGGGFVVGDLDGHDALCRRLAVDSDCVVVSVDYRLAPEHRFPAAVDDAYFATCWIHEHSDSLGIDHRRIAVGGYDAGATLATAVARLAKERRNPPLSFQLLLCPITDLRAFDTLSYRQHGLPTRASLMWCASLYVRNDADRADPRCSPLVAKNLIGLPPALIITAECDPLRDEAEDYAATLRQAHVDVTLSRYGDAPHGFVLMHGQLACGREAVAECARALSRVLGTRA